MPYDNNSFDELGPLHEDPIKNLRIENELLGLKLRAEFGGFTGGTARLPPEVENEFLKKVIEFEQQFRTARLVTVAELIGHPVFKKAWELPDAAITVELKRLNQLLGRKRITVIFIRERDERFQYRFLTDELLHQETEDISVPGMTKCFVYEEFHPDHEITIRERAMNILAAWFGRDAQLLGIYLANQFIQPDGQAYSRDQMIRRMENWMAAYKHFEDCSYSISRISFIMKKDDPRVQAMGHAEGRMKYVAVTPEGWKKVREGPFKIYFSCEGGWWSTFFFYMPGFNS